MCLISLDLRRGGGNGAKVLIRALGPSLAQTGLTGVSSDSTLSLRNANGTQIGANDDWKSAQMSLIQATGAAATNDRESAIVTTLAPGNYTAIVSGFQNAQGLGLVEVYNLNH